MTIRSIAGRRNRGRSSNGASNNGASNNGASNNGASNNGASNNGASNNGASNNGASSNGAGYGVYSGGDAFAPRRFVRHGDVQTVIARRRPVDSVARLTEQPLLLDAGPDESGRDPGSTVRLLGYYNPPLRPAVHRGLVVVIHGWEGSSHSADVQYVSEAALRIGFSVFRLNLRDHGPGLHFDPYALNKGLFGGPLLNEAATAIRRVTEMVGNVPVHLVGGSMGGNFVLRLSVLQGEGAIPNLERTVAVCPAVNPQAALEAIDRHPMYRNFFRRIWMRSLRAKQRSFPGEYDFSVVARMDSLCAMTEWVVDRYSKWGDMQEYFAGYAVTPRMLASLSHTTTIIAAENDAVIPIRDIRAIEPSERLRISVQPTGGHMGFVDVLPYRRWLPGAVMQELMREQ